MQKGGFMFAKNYTFEDDGVGMDAVKSSIQKNITGDIVDVAEVLNDTKKTIAFAVEFAGQQIYISKEVARNLKYLEMRIEYQKLCKTRGEVQAKRILGRTYGYSTAWIRKLLKNGLI